MVNMDYSIVDTFTNTPFSGAQSAVCALDAWPDDALLTKIAAEFNLDCTTFFVPKGDAFELKWFSGAGELSNMKYSLLAAAFVLQNEGAAAERFVFHTRNGRFTIERAGECLALPLPAIEVESRALRRDMIVSLGGALPLSVCCGRDLVFIMEDEDAVRKIKPDFTAMKALPEGYGVFVAAVGRDTDIAARAFWPKIGINEDTVCGSMYANLGPLFQKKLHKGTLTARQLSARGGELLLKVEADTIRLCGKAVLSSSGTMFVPGL